ncbi:MAG: oligoendopeptidase F [Candidatus Kapaibacterium sp.]
MKFNIKHILSGLMIIMLTGFMASCQQKDATDESAAAKGEESGQLLERKDIDPRYTWNLEDIYKSEDQWQQDYNWLKDQVDRLKSFEGRLGSSAQTLLEALRLQDEIGQRFGKVRLYASLSKDIDMRVNKFQEMYQKVMNLAADLQQAGSYMRPEIISIPESKINSFMSQSEELAVYKHSLNDILRMKPHVLAEAQEKLLAMSAPLDEVYMGTYRLFVNADVTFPKVKDEDGKEFELTMGRYYTGMFSTDRDFRKRVYKGIYVPFMDYKNTLSSLYSGSVKDKIFRANSRNYNSTLEWALDQNNIPVSVYKNLISTVNANLDPLHRWAEIKKRELGLDSLHPYDTYVTLFPAVKKKYTYDEATELVLKALEPMGKEYVALLKKAFDNRWVDVYETKGKRSGAYSTGATKETHPYVLLNWTGELNDVFTLAHEMGHNLHSYLTAEHQPAPYADYPIFLAEVASTTNEALLMNYLIEHSESKEEKLALIETYLNNIKSTFYRQTRFAEWEMEMQARAENGEVLTTDMLKDSFGEMYKKYWGPNMSVDDEEKYSWSRVHHFFYNFYVYQYATGFAASQALAGQILSEGQPAVDRYLGFLKAGNSDYAINILRNAGVDMTSPDPVLAVVKKANELMDEMEELLKK